MKGVGACLLQEGEPVAFASKSLSPAQSNYSNIERETLALVFGINRFHTYLFGKAFVVETDHKPLEMIWKKPLRHLGVPHRAFRGCLSRSRATSATCSTSPENTWCCQTPWAECQIRTKHRTYHSTSESKPSVQRLRTYSMSTSSSLARTKREQLQRETSRDPVLRELSQLVTNGWPDTIKEVPTSLRTFWPYRDKLGVSHGVLFKGRQVVIPQVLREDILRQLHIGHMGIERIRRLARETIFWPNINKDVERITKDCDACQELQSRQQKEPLEPHDVPTAPWSKVAADFFHLTREGYLLPTDYYSKYPIVTKMKDTSSAATARVMDHIFGLFGPPAEIVSDNGTQFTGKPYQDMCKKWSITHTTSSPHYPRSFWRNVPWQVRTYSLPIAPSCNPNRLTSEVASWIIARQTNQNQATILQVTHAPQNASYNGRLKWRKRVTSMRDWAPTSSWRTESPGPPSAGPHMDTCKSVEGVWWTKVIQSIYTQWFDPSTKSFSLEGSASQQCTKQHPRQSPDVFVSMTKAHHPPVAYLRGGGGGGSLSNKQKKEEKEVIITMYKRWTMSQRLIDKQARKQNKNGKNRQHNKTLNWQGGGGGELPVLHIVR